QAPDQRRPRRDRRPPRRRTRGVRPADHHPRGPRGHDRLPVQSRPMSTVRRGPMRKRPAAAFAAALLLAVAAGLVRPAAEAGAATVLTFADEDRSSELTGHVVHQRYQFNTPTTVTYVRATIAGNPAAARVYVADMGNHVIRVFDLNGKQIGRLDDADTQLAPDSPASSVPQITAPLGIYFLSKSEAVDDRLAGLYINDVGVHKLHFFRTDPSN